jgi:hypothetical protein
MGGTIRSAVDGGVEIIKPLLLFNKQFPIMLNAEVIQLKRSYEYQDVNFLTKNPKV